MVDVVEHVEATPFSDAPRGGLLRALRIRPFASLWVGQTLSRVGDHAYEVALAWWVLEVTGSAAVMGTVLIFAFLPNLLFLLIGGVAVDRFHRPRLMFASDVVRGVVAAAVALIALGGELEVWHLYLAAVVYGTADAFFQPAYSAVVPQLVPETSLPSANSLTSISVQAGRIAGPIVGGLVYVALGASAAFALNALSFAAGALFLVPLLGPSFASPRTSVRTETESGESPAAVHLEGESIHLAVEARSDEEPYPEGALKTFTADVRAGWAVVTSQPFLLITIALFALTNITLAGPYSVAMPFLVEETLGGGSALLGILYACFALGYLIAAVVLGRTERLPNRGALLYGGVAVAGLALASFGLAPAVGFLMIAAVVNGFALEAGGLAWVSALQEIVPNDMLGRVASIDQLGSFALLPIAFALAGWATQALSAQAVFLLGGLATAGVACMAAVHPAVRRFR